MSDTQPTGGKKFGLFFINKKGSGTPSLSAQSTTSTPSTIFATKTQQDSNSEDELDEQASKVLSTICLEKI